MVKSKKSCLAVDTMSDTRTISTPSSLLLIREIHGSGANEMTRSVNHTNNIPLVSDTNYNDLHNSQREVTQLQII